MQFGGEEQLERGRGELTCECGDLDGFGDHDAVSTFPATEGHQAPRLARRITSNAFIGRMLFVSFLSLLISTSCYRIFAQKSTCDQLTKQR